MLRVKNMPQTPKVHELKMKPRSIHYVIRRGEVKLHTAIPVRNGTLTKYTLLKGGFFE